MKLLSRSLCQALFLCTFFQITLIAQSLKSYVPPGPNAASLGIYGQVPVSEYSGVPEISIPLHTISTGDFNMPVSITYHGRGFRTSDEASWVGLGWALNIGGVITRSKRQLDDFSQWGYFRKNTFPPGFPNLCHEDIDQEPDMFYYNFNGYTGKFVLDVGTGGQPFIVRSFTQENIRFEYDMLNSAWNLTTDDGVKYVFSKTEMTTERTVSPSADGPDKDKSETYISSWYISSIILPDNSRINYTYQTPLNTKVLRATSSSVKSSLVSIYPPELGSGCCAPGSVEPGTFYSYSNTSILSDDVVLTQVDYPTGKIVLNTSNRTDLRVGPGLPPGKKLDKIDIYMKVSGADVYLKSFQMGYDYFSSGSTAPPAISTRLRLRNINEKTQTAAFKPYSFYYISDYVDDKSSHGGFMGSNGIIQSIVYPTGGSTRFEFEPNEAGSLMPGPKGLRIRQIYALDPANKLDVRNFEYTGGKLMGDEYEFFSTDLTTSVIVPAGSCCSYQSTVYGSVRRKLVVSANYSTMSETVNGAMLGYDKVVTYFGENGQNGKREAYFENVVPPPINYYSGIFPVPVPLNISARNGNLNDEYTYSKVNGAYVLLNRVHNEYSSANAKVMHVRRFAYDKCEDFPYDITTEWIRPSLQTVYHYDQNGTNPVISTTQYYYDQTGNCLPTRIVSTDSKNNTIQTTNHYVQEKASLLGGVYATMLSRNMIGAVIDEDYLRDNVLLTKKSRTYKDWLNNGKVIKPYEEFIQKGPLGSLQLEMRYNGYLENGKVASFSKNGGKPVSYIWGYDDTYPIAEVNNAPLQPVNEMIPRSQAVGQFLDLSASPASVSFTPFKTNVGQPVTYTVKVIMEGTNPSGMITVNLRSSNGTVHTGTYYSANTYTETAQLPEGTDSYYFSVNWTGVTATTTRVDIKINYNEARIHRSIFHTSFEDLTTGFQNEGKTGSKSVTGPFNVPMPWTLGKYILSWWEKTAGSSGAWVYKEQPVSITTTNAADYTIGSSTVLLDEVRLYPADALMRTYTYKPGVGMLTKCDERNVVTYYEYDDLLRLKIIRDEDRNIQKTVDYNYKNY